MNIFEIMEYGAICASDEETGIIVSVNGAYLNLWVMVGGGRWENTDCKAINSTDPYWNGLYSITAADTIDLAEDYLSEVLAEDL